MEKKQTYHNSNEKTITLHDMFIKTIIIIIIKH